MPSPRCPICRKPAADRLANPDYPFCSSRCKLLDLGNWLGESYCLPGPAAGDGVPAEGRGAAQDER